MNRRVPPALKADQSLQRVEALLDQALVDLAGTRGTSPGELAAHLLTDVYAELQIFAGLLPASEADHLALAPRMKAIFPRLKTAERLLTAAAEFYRGWCSATPSFFYPGLELQVDQASHGPALLALEG